MGAHHRRHAFRELDPNRILRLHASFARQDGTAGADDIRQMVEWLSHCRVAEKLRDGGQARRRARIKENGARRGVPVSPALFHQDAVDRKEIAEDPDAAFGC